MLRARLFFFFVYFISAGRKKILFQLENLNSSSKQNLPHNERFSWKINDASFSPSDKKKKIKTNSWVKNNF